MKRCWLVSASLLVFAAKFPANLNAAPGDLKWQLPLNLCSSGAPVLATNGDLLVGSCDGNVYDVEPSGTIRWSFQTPHSVVGVPVVAPDGTIYFGSDNLYALNPDGTERWMYTVPEPATGGYVPYDNTPTIGADGAIYVVNGVGNLYALNPDGTLRWEVPSAHGSPGVVGSDGTLYLVLPYGGFTAVDMDGVTRWTKTLGNTTAPPAAIAADGTLLVPVSGATALEGTLQALNPAGSNLWTFDGAAQADGSPVVGPDGTIYYGFYYGLVVALEPNGQTLWQAQIEGTNAIEGLVGTPALASDGTLYITADHFLDALDSSGNLLWQFDAKTNYLGDCLVGPDGTVYFAAGNGNATLFAVEGTGAPLATGFWPMAGRDVRHSGSVAGTLAPPATPTNVTATLGSLTDKVHLQWNSVPAASYYQVLRGPTSDPAQATVVASAVTGGVSYDDHSAVPGTLYFYFLCASNISGISPPSTPVQGQRRVAMPGEAVWTYTTGGSINSPAVASDGTAYFGSSDGYVYSFTDGGVMNWKFAYGGKTCASPSIGLDGTIYFTAGTTNNLATHANDVLAAFALRPDGSLKWQIPIAGETASGVAIGGDGGLYLEAGVVYAPASISSVLALNSDGTVRWTFQNGHNFQATPVIGFDGTVYCPTQDGFVEALRTNGTKIWESNLSDGYLKSPVIDSNGVLFVAGSNVHALNPDGQTLWTFLSTYGADVGPVCVDSHGTVYAQDDYTYYTFDPAGTNAVKFGLPGYQENMISTPVRDTNGVLYLPVYDYSGSGAIFARSASGTVQWQFGSESFGGLTLGPNSALYAPGSDNSLYVLRTSGGLDNSAWPHPLHDPQHTGRSVAAPPMPPAPISVSATVDTRVTDIQVTWSAAVGASSYQVFRSNDTNVADAVLITNITGQLFFDDNTTVPETGYTYWIKASNVSGASAFSTPTSGVRRQAVPGDALYVWNVVGPVTGSPAVGDDGTIYVSVNQGISNGQTVGWTLTALAPDGSIRWQYPAAGPSLSSPTITSDGTILFGVQTVLDGYAAAPLVALNPDGTVRWQYVASDAIISTPALAADGTIYFSTEDGNLYAVNSQGQTVWTVNIGTGVDASPAVGRDGTIYFFCHDGQLRAFDPNGVLIWSATAGTVPIADAPDPSLALGLDGTIYTSVGNGGVKAFNPDGTLRWQAGGGPYYATPIVTVSNTIVVPNGGGALQCILPSGTNLWSTNTGGFHYGSAAASSGGLLYVADYNGNVDAISLAGANVWATNLGVATETSMTIAGDGTLYVGGDDGKVRSFYGTGTLADSPWPMFQHDAKHTGRDANAPTLPSVPGSVSASDGGFPDRVRVSWVTAFEARSYEVWRSTQNDINTAVLVATNVGAQDFWDDTTAGQSAHYYYWVRAINGVGASGFSAPDSGYLGAGIFVWGNYPINNYAETNVPASATNVISLAAGDSHCLALRADGTVVAWGAGGAQINVPPNLTNVVSIAAGSTHSIALRSDGTLAAWGNIYGNSSPITVPPGATNVAALALGPGAEHALILRADGTPLDWGNSTSGLTNIPPLARDLVSVASGSVHCLGLRSDGKVIAWGSAPTVPASATNIVAIATGWYGDAGLRSDGTVLVWGSIHATTPAFTNVADLACPLNSISTGDILALRANGTLVETPGSPPTMASNITAIAAGSYNGFAAIARGAPIFPGLPLNRTVAVGSRAYFRMKASGALPMFYQWQCNGTNVPGATNSVLVLTNVQSAQAGSYYSLIASNALGTATSGNMTLGVVPLEVGIQPGSLVVLPGTNVTFTSSVIGNGPFGYQWQFGGTNLNGMTNSSLSLTNVQIGQTGVYSLIVTNAYGTITNTQAVLNVVPLMLAVQPQQQLVLAGTNTTFTATPGGQGPFGYQWQFDGTNLDGATNSSLVISNIQPSQAGFYSVMGSNSFGSASSANAALSVTPMLITSQPTKQTVTVGTNASFSVAITSLAPLYYQWQCNGTNVPGVNGNPLQLTNIQFNQAGSYAVIVTNMFGVSTSSSAALVVIPLAIVSGPQSQVGYLGLGATFSVVPVFQGPFDYQWQFDGTNIQGATSAQLVLTNLGFSQAGQYSVTVSNAYGATNSAQATLIVRQVAAWGDTTYGETNVPADLTNAIMVAAGESVSVALTDQAKVRAWGLNNYGQTNVPLDLTNVVAIAAGYGHCLALRADGTVRAWGDYFDGSNYHPAVPPAGLSNVVAIAAGEYHALALRADGTVAAWGYDYYGETNVPAGLSNVVAISGGGFYSLALKTDGTVVGWGSQGWGETNFPPNLTNVVAISAGMYHGLALKGDGSVVGWGDDSTGATDIPLAVANPMAIEGGAFYTVALEANGSVVVWGSGPTNVPVNLTRASQVSAGGEHVLALTGLPPAPKVLSASKFVKNGGFSVSLPSQSGRVYALQYKNSLAGTTWVTLALTAGNGSVLTLTDPNPTDSQRFYRVRQW